MAAEALQRRRGGAEALPWLAERVAGWGQVYVVEALCRRGATTSRTWLLRDACDGDHLNGYCAGDVATTAHLHEAITSTDADDELIDHTGRLLRIMADCGGMGMTLEHYPPAPSVLTPHAAHLTRQSPSANRHIDAAMIADRLVANPPHRTAALPSSGTASCSSTSPSLTSLIWRVAVRAGLDPGSEFFAWFADHVAGRLRLNARSGGTGQAPHG